MANFSLDVETAGTESTSVILSAAVVVFDLEPKNLPKKPDLNAYYDTLISSALFVKFDAMEQYKTYGRLLDKETLKWWDKQGSLVKDLALKPSKIDVPATHGLMLIRDYIMRNGDSKNIIWIRGSLDQLALDSLAKSIGQDILAPFWAYRDTRTAIDCLAENPDKNGYCNTRFPFDRDKVIKHIPTHDAAYDALMLTFME